MERAQQQSSSPIEIEVIDKPQRRRQPKTRPRRATKITTLAPIPGSPPLSNEAQTSTKSTAETLRELDDMS